MSSILEHLDDFCYPDVFWRRDGNGMVYPFENGSNWFDSVDFSLCFQDTAILYAIVVIFWILSAVNFLCANGNKPSIPFNWKNVTKIVLCCIIIIVTLCDLSYSIARTTMDATSIDNSTYKNAVPKYLFLSPLVLASTMV
jgi:hypothetical protein